MPIFGPARLASDERACASRRLPPRAPWPDVSARALRPPRAMSPARALRPDAWRVLALVLTAFALGRTTAPESPSRTSWWEASSEGDARALGASPDVTPGKPSPPGAGSFSFSDARGTYERREFPRESPSGGEPFYVNVIHTRAGHLRSGDVHRCHQVNVLAAGRATLTTLHGPRFDREVVTHLRAGDHVVIPPNVPHLYAFEEESVMTESWVRGDNRTQCPFEARFFAPLRRRIPERTQRSAFARENDDVPKTARAVEGTTVD